MSIYNEKYMSVCPHSIQKLERKAEKIWNKAMDLLLSDSQNTFQTDDMFMQYALLQEKISKRWLNE